MSTHVFKCYTVFINNVEKKQATAWEMFWWWGLVTARFGESKKSDCEHGFWYLGSNPSSVTHKLYDYKQIIRSSASVSSCENGDMWQDLEDEVVGMRSIQINK